MSDQEVVFYETWQAWIKVGSSHVQLSVSPYLFGDGWRYEALYLERIEGQSMGCGSCGVAADRLDAQQRIVEWFKTRWLPIHLQTGEIELQYDDDLEDCEQPAGTTQKENEA